MRIIKLSNNDPDTEDITAVRKFFEEILPSREPIGRFNFKTQIKKDGLAQGEWLVFSYEAKIVYVATVESGVVQEAQNPRYFCVNTNALMKGNRRPLKALQEELEKIMEKENVPSLSSQGWNRIDIEHELARQLLQDFVLDELVPDVKKLQPIVSLDNEKQPDAKDGIVGREACDLDEPPARVKYKNSRIIRDTKLSHEIKERNNRTCQICKEPLCIDESTGEKYAEAHHIQPLGEPHNGPDIPENMICVCPNCHALLDYGAIKLPDAADIGGGHEIGQEYIDYHNREVNKS